MGQCGGGGGQEWSYVFQGGLKEILIDHEKGYIKSMFFKDDQGFSPKYGSQDNEHYEKIPLDWPSEYLVRIDGTYGDHSGWRGIIKSLTFVTNVITYGPYGTKNVGDRSFTIPIKSAYIKCQELSVRTTRIGTDRRPKSRKSLIHDDLGEANGVPEGRPVAKERPVTLSDFDHLLYEEHSLYQLFEYQGFLHQLSWTEGFCVDTLVQDFFCALVS
ncbi:Mannose/glucose-specific lectin [Morella rubra]|uniref:Mannose/glucose-specific lectin n=1 Tax=Morella rubra TaxID=262757 RepID=A0A6A1W999_9ROSI|nr:Mannose/glucose-specific lectin [Morella rubra]